MKKPIVITLMIVLVSALLLGGCAKPSPAPTPAPAPAPAPQAQVIELSLNLPTPPMHSRWLENTEPWTKEIEKRTNGKVKIVPYHAEALSPQRENFDSIVSGIADMGESGIQPQGARFPLAGSIPGLATPSMNIGNPANIMWALYKSFPAIQDEFKGAKVLFIHAVPSTRIATIKTPINTLEDFKGLKINIIGSPVVVNKVKLLNTSPVSIPNVDTYMSLEKGVADGSYADYELLVARKWGEILKHITTGSIEFGSFYMAMNLDKWNSLPADVQKVFEEMSGDYAVKFYGESAANRSLASKKKWEGEMGGTTHYLPAEELAKWDALVKPVIDSFVKDMEGKGVPYQAIYDKFLELEKAEAVPWP